jgi:rhamnose transport system substrate-binding protein
LGYLTIEAAAAVARGQLQKGATNFVSKKVGNVRIEGDNLILGQPFIFNKSNIAEYNF